eukprot:1048571-Amphidinium_carterae.4
MLVQALQASGHPAASIEPAAPLRVSIPTPRTEQDEDLDAMLDCISLPPATPSQRGPEEDAPDLHANAPVEPQRTQVPSMRPLTAHGPHMQHMGLHLVPDTIAVTRTDGKRVSMRRRVMPLYGTCHYSVRAKPVQMGPFKATAALALQAWVTKHGHTLQQESQDELAAMLEQVTLIETSADPDQGEVRTFRASSMRRYKQLLYRFYTAQH